MNFKVFIINILKIKKMKKLNKKLLLIMVFVIFIFSSCVVLTKPPKPKKGVHRGWYQNPSRYHTPYHPYRHVKTPKNNKDHHKDNGEHR